MSNKIDGNIFSPQKSSSTSITDQPAQIRIVGDTAYCYGNIPGNIVTSAHIVNLINCKVSGAIFFVHENRERFKGKILKYGDSNIQDLEKTKAKIVDMVNEDNKISLYK